MNTITTAQATLDRLIAEGATAAADRVAAYAHPFRVLSELPADSWTPEHHDEYQALIAAEVTAQQSAGTTAIQCAAMNIRRTAREARERGETEYADELMRLAAPILALHDALAPTMYV